jgi:hypothetical protein
MVTNAMVAVTPVMIQELLKTPSILKEQTFLNLPSEIKSLYIGRLRRYLREKRKPIVPGKLNV